MTATDQPRRAAVLTFATLVEGLREIHDHTVQAAATVRADADEQVRALEVTAARLAAERDTARGEARVAERVNAALKTRLHDAGAEIRGLNEQVVELTTKRDLAMRIAEIACCAQWAAERELHERDTRRWRRKRRH